MKPLEQRKAIAKACGWHTDTRQLGWLSPSGAYDVIPDYLNDLNAMREAELAIIRDWEKWTKMLAKVIAGCPTATRAGGHRVYVQPCLLITSSPAHRAEAFLRTLDLWEDSP